MKKSYLLIGGIVVVVLAVAILAMSMNNKTPTTSNTTASSGPVKVSLANYMFTPMSSTIKVGTTITWTNTDSVHHSVTAVTASKYAPSSPLLAQNQSYSFKFTKAGTYAIYCEIHPYMHETVTVTN
jgi:plastocyanin